MILRNIAALLMVALLALTGCEGIGGDAANQDRESVENQQLQYQKGQPVPSFNWSLERELVISLYKVRNQKASTHSVWRSDRGMVEGDCPSYGYGIPYDTSLTNPLKPYGSKVHSLVSIEQAEPNGIFASKNTAATWVLCLGNTGLLEPVYVETKVTVYPGPVRVDYETQRVVRYGDAAVTIKK